MLVVLLSVALMIVDLKFKYLDYARHHLGTLLVPIYWIANIPYDLKEKASLTFSSRQELEEQVDLMRARILVLESKAERLASRTAELNRLRELLTASRIVDDGVMVAELVGANADPDHHYIWINKGSQDGVYHGQAVLDSHGLMGQIVESTMFTSRVLLISDLRHAVPVEVQRNEMRAIAYGTGSLSTLELGNVPGTADIEVGDLLVSSGLGGRFPRGYPVARVTAVSHNPGDPFARVQATPEAKLNRSRLVLLVLKSELEASASEESEPAEDAKARVLNKARIAPGEQGGR